MFAKGEGYPARVAALSLLLAVPSLAANHNVSDEGIDCVFSGEDGTGSAEDVCAQFVDAVERSGRTDIARLQIRALTPTSARVLAYGHKDEIVAELDYKVMDATLRPSTWKNFAAGFARFLAEH